MYPICSVLVVTAVGESRGERRRFIRAEYVGDRLAGLALSSANAKRQRSTR